MSSQTIALIAIVLASVFWATAGVVGKILLTTFDPFTLAFLRFLVAGLVNTVSGWEFPLYVLKEH